MTDDQIKNIADQLKSIYWHCDLSNNNGFFRMARHVERLRIEARLDEMRIVQGIPGKELWIIDRIAVLKKELEALRGDNEEKKTDTRI